MRAIGDMQRKDSPAAKSRLDAKQGQNLMATTPEYKRVSAVATNVLAAYNDKLQPSLQLPRFEAGRLFVVVQDEINAYTMPNGDIYVNTGLLDAIALGARNSELGPLGADDILAFVLGTSTLNVRH
jgi:predicted Zn-dependent protease